MTSLYSKTISIGPNILFNAITILTFNKDNLKSLKNTNKKLYRLPTPNDARKFRKIGKKFI